MSYPREMRGLAAATLILTATPVAMADVTGTYVVRYTVTAEDFGGTEVTVNVADIYLSSDDPNDTVLNAYDLSITDAGKVPYFQSFAGTGWLPNNSGGLFDTAAVRSADSFITVGGFAQGVTFPEQTPGAGTGSGIDPSFGGNDTDYPGDHAGWFNGSPPSLNGQVGQIARPDGGFGLGVLIGRFSYAGPFNLNGSNLSVTWNQGLGTPGKQQLFVMSDPVDCNANGIPDDQDILDGTSADCDGSFIPDECEIADGTALDCNQNGVPDQCEINEGTSEDCNQNGVPDDCDVADPANDYNQNGVPDSCEGLTVPGDFESIADAIATAPVGSVVFVEPGFYDQPIVLDRAVAIVASNGPGSTKLDGSKSLGPVVIVDNAPSGAVLAGFTIRAGDPSGEHPMGGGIVGVDSYATIADCVIVGNTGMEGGGLRFEGGYPTITGCEIRENLSYGPGGGLWSIGFEMTDCTMESNISLTGVGHAVATRDGYLANTSLTNHGADGTVLESSSDLFNGLVPIGTTLQDCTISNNGGTGASGFDLSILGSFVGDNGGDGVVEAWQIRDSTISGNGGIGYRGTVLDPEYFTDNTICGNTEGALEGTDPAELLGSGNIILDDRCPDLIVPDDADTIQLAIDISIDGERIVVRPGEYTEPDIDLLGRDIELLSSEGRDATIINGNLIARSGEPATTIVRGFTVQNGDGLLVPLGAGGGLFIDGGSSPTIEESAFIDNAASNRGGGIFVDGGSTTIRDTIVADNDTDSFGTGGGGIYLASGALTLENVTVFDNSIPLATENRGGGVYVEGGAELILIDTTICDNARENLANFGVVSDQGGNTICLAEDCDGNGIEDASDIGDLGRPDCDGNLVPDDCDLVNGAADCNQNGVPDSCDIESGSSEDCNQNGIPDECDLAAGRSNGIVSVTFEEFMGTEEIPLSNQIEGLLFAPGTAGVPWIACDAANDSFNRSSWDCALEEDRGISWGSGEYWVCDFVAARTSALGVGNDGVIELPNGSTFFQLRYASASPLSLIAYDADGNEIGIDTQPANLRYTDGNETGPGTLRVDAPTETRISYVRITDSGTAWIIDSIVTDALYEGSDVDCDGNGILDECELADGSAIDCDGNNAIDSCEIAADPGLDCDDDGILDSCELADGTAPDINQNGVHDACESQLVFNVPSTFTTIASAFAVAPDGSVIGLDPGVYTEPIDFADRNLVIRGDLDDPSAVVIDGSAAPASIVTFAGGQTSDAGLEGLTVTGGTMGTPLPGQPTSLAGGAVFVNGCSPHFDRVIFRDNVAGFGGGVYALGGDSTYVDCVFRNNFASTDGGGFMSFDSNAEVRGCIFDDNRAVNDGGATKIARGQALIVDCEIFENQATEGGGIYFFSSPDTVPLRIEGTSVTNNLATKFGGGIKARFGLPGFTILDSIMCDNQPDSIVGDYEDLGGNTLCVCPCDLNGDGLVNGVDLGLYLGYQSTCIPGEYCPIDFDGDGVITGGDLGLLLGAWGLCP